VAECKITTDYPATGIIKEIFRIFTECFYITPLLWCFLIDLGNVVTTFAMLLVILEEEIF